MHPLKLFAVTAALTSIVAGCTGSSSEDSVSGESDVTASTKVCTHDNKCPQTFGDLTKLNSGELRELFDKGSVGDTVFKGVYSGVPLCFPQEIPAADSFPSGARAVFGFDALIGAVRLLNQEQMNGLAGFIWHGKKFTPRADGTLTEVTSQDPSAPVVAIADVTNNIGRPDVDFSAEATLVLNRHERSIDLDYHGARTGLQLPSNINIPGVSGITTEVIQHIWDRVRLIDAKQNLYLGEAYVVGTAGVYDKTAVPMCFFALTPEGSPAAAK